MYFHREGKIILISFFLILVALVAIATVVFGNLALWIGAGIGAILFVLVAQFFRVPARKVTAQADDILSPSDGKVVVIEEVEETEYFKDKRIQISIFMSPLNVHVQWTPMAGVVDYVKYHPGLYLVAWHPKSSTDNERTSLVIKGARHTVLFRQIAGAVARRIIYYLKEGQTVGHGEECGFIKFGSRIDVFLPLDAKINVAIGDKVVGRKTILARLK